MTRTTLFAIVTGLLLAAGLHAIAQTPNAQLADKIIEARKANAKLMQQFQWNCRTELIDHGKVKDIRIDLVTVSPDGKLQRSLINDQNNTHLPIGFLRRAIAENQKKQLEQYLTGLRGLLDQYTLPSAGRVIDFMAGANIEFTTAPDGTNLLELAGQNAVQPGDSLTIWVDASTHATRKVQITTTYEGDEATATASYKTLTASNLTYLSMAEVSVPSKQINLQVQNYDYEQND